MVNYRNVIFEFQEQSEFFPLMTDECDKKNDNLVAMSYEDDFELENIEQEQPAMVEEGKIVEDHANVFPMAHKEEKIQIDFCPDLPTDHQDMFFAHDFRDPLYNLLQSLDQLGCLVLDHGFQLQLYVKFPIFKLFVDSVSRGKSGIQLLDWLHWHFSFT